MQKVSDYLNGISRKQYTVEEKKKLSAYMWDRKHLFGASTKRFADRVTGETVNSVCLLLYEDGEYKWNSSEAYHFEKYDLALFDEFIQHVLEKETEKTGDG